MKHLALHTCCAPCLIGVYDLLASEYAQITVVFYNPNIAPRDEYLRRRDTCAQYAEENKISFVEIDPAETKPLKTGAQGREIPPIDNSFPVPAADRAAAGTMHAETDLQLQLQRCCACYMERLTTVAAWADKQAALGGPAYDSLATTLSISPWQNLEAINKAGLQAVSHYPQLSFAQHDFRDYYRTAQNEARNLGLYRQNYCGCLPSKEEADRGRRQRKELRKKKRSSENAS